MTQEEILQNLKSADINSSVTFLYSNYFEQVVRSIASTGGNRQDGADIFQEAVIVLIDKVKTGAFKQQSGVGTFLLAIAKNLWLHEMRTRGRRVKREKMFMQDVPTGQEPESRVANPAGRYSITQLLQSTGEVCMKILTGFYYQDKSMRELLEEFNYENEQVLRNRKSKCMKKIKDLLSADKNLLENLKNLSMYE
ncbi:RNA polymerase sigma factor [Foetidibacter luteolus]|uniref:RNA polymerase sigma factor n=1 Tax=Foetidibacter luteolus TaxID=2608880 RepID=UPI001A99A049|nr:sigma-70 family RNA polymerase sigma factor [Foetidibacter luteolus]